MTLAWAGRHSTPLPSPIMGATTWGAMLIATFNSATGWADKTITSAAALAEATARRRPGIMAAAPGSVEATAAWLANEVRAGDAVLVMGGGKSYRIAELLVAALAG